MSGITRLCPSTSADSALSVHIRGTANADMRRGLRLRRNKTFLLFSLRHLSILRSSAFAVGASSTDSASASSSGRILQAPFSTGPMITVRDLTKLYSNLTAVSHLTFDIGPGEVLGLVGPNGAGKTTTLRCLCGIMAPSAGGIAIARHHIQTHAAGAKRPPPLLPAQPPPFDLLPAQEEL